MSKLRHAARGGRRGCRTLARVFEALERRALFCATHWGPQELFLSADGNSADFAAPVGENTTTSSLWVRRFNFQIDGTPSPDFYRVDTGDVFTTRSNGLTYGWNADNRHGRDRNALVDQRYDTLHHLQKNGQNLTWEFAVANGTYTVRVVAGDPSFTDSVYRVNVEGQLTVSGTPTSANRFFEGTKTVNVTDGRLTISNGSGAVNNKIAFIEITRGSSALPVVSVAATDASAGEGGNNTGTFTFTRTGSLAGPLTVDYLLGGTATNGVDYQSLSGKVTFAAGSATATVVVAPIDDTAVESTETVTLGLVAMQHYSNAFGASATIGIADNDAPAPPPPTGGWPTGTLRWQTVAPNPVPRVEGYGAVIGGKFYTFGGYLTTQYRPSKVGHVYDPSTNKWTALRDAPLELTHAAVADDGRFMFVAGGYPPGSQGPTGPQAFASERVFRYDTTNDTWISLPNLPQKRGSGAMVLLGRNLHFFGGSDASRIDRNDHWMLNLDNTSAGWVARAPMPAGRNHFGAVALNGFAYAVGGQTKQDLAAVFHADVFRYDPAANTWSSVAPMLSPARSHANNTTIVHRGRIVVMGGEVSNYSTRDNVDAYDPVANKWSVLTSLPRRTTAGIAGSFGDRIVFSTGNSGGLFRTETYIGAFS